MTNHRRIRSLDFGPPDMYYIPWSLISVCAALFIRFFFLYRRLSFQFSVTSSVSQSSIGTGGVIAKSRSSTVEDSPFSRHVFEYRARLSPPGLCGLNYLPNFFATGHIGHLPYVFHHALAGVLQSLPAFVLGVSIGILQSVPASALTFLAAPLPHPGCRTPRALLHGSLLLLIALLYCCRHKDRISLDSDFHPVHVVLPATASAARHFRRHPRKAIARERMCWTG
ncbi:hypothetical protein BDV95DRAFT_114341 [Massariosphaeria phaeospora]|uniref:Uncharacterized protein n=1 Tax=Massariosphaeria phaeospora TaxID=100035 RepID=A0A7C8MGX7_9PLEO|nr:hypothetical protein BDV95DRAFT_114341 [Massariosphaeria phaeospora]